MKIIDFTLLSYIIIVAVYALETLIAFLQAYVYIVLLLMYLKGSIPELKVSVKIN
jgi:F0F1-type ATP synthase membrane subunit a